MNDADRIAMHNELAAAGCTTVGFEWNLDALVERVYHDWKAQGSPRYAVLIVERDEKGNEVTIVEVPEAITLE